MEAEDTLLSLKWNNHKSTFVNVLCSLREKALYTDATLACEGKFFPVHKLVISACSDYFSEVFERTACKSPVVILKDISAKDLEYLLNYIYVGEVKVEQKELANLIKAAECLRIKGLAIAEGELQQLETQLTAKPIRSPRPLKKGKRFKGSDTSRTPPKHNQNSIKQNSSLDHEDSSYIAVRFDIKEENLPNSDTEEHEQSDSLQALCQPSSNNTTENFDSDQDDNDDVTYSQDEFAGRFLEIVQDEENIKCEQSTSAASHMLQSAGSPFAQMTNAVDDQDPSARRRNANISKRLYVPQKIDNPRDHKPVLGNARRRCVACGRAGREKRTKIICTGCNLPYCLECFTPCHES